MPSVIVQRVVPEDVRIVLTHHNLPRLALRGIRNDTYSQPDPTIRGEHERSQLVVDETLLPLAQQMEVVGDAVIQSLLLRYLIEKAESRSIDLHQHVEFIGRDMLHVETITHLQHLLTGMSAQEKRIVRNVEETLLEIVDDIYALVDGLRKGLCSPYQWFHLAIVQALRLANGILRNEKMGYLYLHKIKS